MEPSEIKRIISLRCYEDELYSIGYQNIAGVDEVGRGSLAGPLVAAAVILDPRDMMLENINDSKKLSESRRQELFKKITACCKCWSIAGVSPSEIDENNITEANIKAYDMAISGLEIKPDIALTDFLNIDSKKLKSLSNTGFIPVTKGDSRCISIAAASIIAKVIRDRLMKKYAVSYPEYGFGDNKGYGTRKHLASLKEFGPTAIHRTTFRGVMQ